MASTGDVIKKLLTEQGKTQAQLARALKIATTTVNRWITKNIPPKTENLFQIAEFFNVSVDVLLDGRKDAELAEWALRKGKETGAFYALLETMGYTVTDNSAEGIDVDADNIGTITNATVTTICWDNDGFKERREVSATRFDTLLQKYKKILQIEIEDLY